MSENKSVDIIKEAILLEHKGLALYRSVIERTEVQPVKELFLMLAQEEEKHIKLLNKQFKRLTKGENMDTTDLESDVSSAADKILSEAIIDNVFGAGYEAAIIAAALEFERKAVNFYSQQASEACEEEEQQLYQWLTDWEKSHMVMLAKIDKEIKEQIWFDNRFWPY